MAAFAITETESKEQSDGLRAVQETTNFSNTLKYYKCGTTRSGARYRQQAQTTQDHY